MQTSESIADHKVEQKKDTVSPTLPVLVDHKQEPKAKPRKLLKLSEKAKAFRPEEVSESDLLVESNIAPPVKPAAQPYSLMADLNPVARPLVHHVIPSNSTPYVPQFINQPQYPMQYAMPVMNQYFHNIPHPQMFHQPHAMMPQPQENTEDDYNMMFQTLVNHSMVNCNPATYNQLRPGDSLSTNLRMQPALQEFAEQMGEYNQEELTEYYQDMMDGIALKQEHSFGDQSGNHTYSDLGEEDFDLPFENETGENPDEWNLDPETAKRREEIRKNFFNPNYKDCECCKGFISNCGNQICKNLEVCHCVLRKQNEDSGIPTDNDFITECKDCDCCKGLVYKCICVSNNKKSNC